MFTPMKFSGARKATLAIALAASALASATPAMADPYYGRHRGRGGDTAGAAIVGGIIGIALGAIIASSSDNNRNRHYADRRYDPRVNGQWRGQPSWNGQQGWNNQPNWNGQAHQNGQPSWNGQYDQRYQGGQEGYSRDGYPLGNDGYYDRRGYRENQGQYDQPDDDRGN